MTLGEQIFWGSGILSVCLVLHVSCLVLCTQLLSMAGPRVQKMGMPVRIGILLFITLIVLVFALTVQVWVWAGFWIRNDILPDWNSAVYFSLVTFTALGYGDIVLGPEVRVFSTFGSVTGLLSFGLSTAYLVAVMTRILGPLLDLHDKRASKQTKGTS